MAKTVELLPFGAARRVCLGEALARMEIFLFLANLFNQLKVNAGNFQRVSDPARSLDETPFKPTMASFCDPNRSMSAWNRAIELDQYLFLVTIRGKTYQHKLE